MKANEIELHIESIITSRLSSTEWQTIDKIYNTISDEMQKQGLIKKYEMPVSKEFVSVRVGIMIKQGKINTETYRCYDNIIRYIFKLNP